MKFPCPTCGYHPALELTVPEYLAMVQEKNNLVREVAKLQELNRQLAERVAAQSEILSKNAENKP